MFDADVLSRTTQQNTQAENYSFPLENASVYNQSNEEFQKLQQLPSNQVFLVYDAKGGKLVPVLPKRILKDVWKVLRDSPVGDYFGVAKTVDKASETAWRPSMKH
jgi:hypothetical protein